MNENPRQTGERSDPYDFYRNASREALITEMLGDFEDITSDIPTIVCRKDLLMIYANESAKFYLKGDINTYMKSYIDDADNLSIIAMEINESGAPDHLLVRLNSFHGFACALVKKLDLFGHELIVLYLFRSNFDYLHLKKIMSANTAAVISEINRRPVSTDSKLQAQQIAFSSLISGDETGSTSKRFDVKEAVHRIIRDVCENVISIDCSFSFNEVKHPPNTCFVTVAPLDIFVKLMVAALFVMNDVTFDQKISIGFLNDGTCTIVRLSTKQTRFPLNFVRSSELSALRDIIPSCTMQLIMCDYLAANAGCRITASGSTSDDSLTVSIHVPADSKPVNVRSADQFEGFAGYLDEAMCLIIPR